MRCGTQDLVYMHRIRYVVGVTTIAERPPRRRRQTQQERSAATREALITATIESLIDVGYDGSTLNEISERAGLSRGAHLHHFQTRAPLFAAAIQELARRGGAELQDGAERLPRGKARPRAALDMLWQLFSGPLFQAALELSVHARTDRELRAQLEPFPSMVGRKAMPWLRLAFTGDSEDQTLDGLIAMSVATIRGLAILPLLDPRDHHADHLWARSREELRWLIEGRVSARSRRSDPNRRRARR